MTTDPMLDDQGQLPPTFGFLNAHQSLRRDAARFASASQHLARGALDAEAQQAMRDHWSAYRTILEEHHRFEDDHLFPAVRDLDPQLKPIIDELADDHEALHRLLPRISADLERAGEPDVAAALATAFGELDDLLEPHFTAEEDRILPLLGAAMAAASAEAATAGDAPAEPPLPHDFVVPFATEHLDADVRAKALALFPGGIDPAKVDGWLEAYRARLALWAI